MVFFEICHSFGIRISLDDFVRSKWGSVNIANGYVCYNDSM